MLDQCENAKPLPVIVTPEEDVHQSLLADSEVSKQVITTFSDEELEAITGSGPRIEGVKAV